MSAAQLYVVGGRLLGIYLLCASLASLPSGVLSYIAVSASPTAAQHDVSAVGTLVAGLLSSCIWVISAVLLIRYFARQPIDNESKATFDQTSFFLSAVKLIGLYWLIDSALRSLQIVASSIGVQNILQYRMGDLIGALVGIPAGLFVMRYAERLVRLFLVDKA